MKISHIGSKKKICLIMPSLDAGGTENFMLRFIQLYHHKYAFTVISINTNIGDLHNKYKQLGVNIIYKRLGYFNIFSLIWLLHLFLKNKFHVVGTLNGNFGGIPLFLARCTNIKARIAFFRRSTNAFNHTKSKLLYNRTVNRLVYLNATKILSNSKFAFQNFFPNEFQHDERFKVIPNGVPANEYDTPISKRDAREQLGLAQDLFVIGHVGRYDGSKNQHTILNVAKLLKEKGNKFLLIFCGKNTDCSSMKEKVRALKLEDSVKLLGLQSNIPLVLRTLDLFYFPSLTEGQPNALIEAMLAGVPIIASKIPPIIEVLPCNSQNALVHPKGEHETVAKIEQLIGDTRSREKYIFKQWAREKFDMTKNFQLLEQEMMN